MAHKTFFLRKKEIELLNHIDIEKRLDGIVGETWEEAYRCMLTEGLQMETKKDTSKRIIGFDVYLKGNDNVEYEDVPDEVIKMLNEPFPFTEDDGFIDESRKMHRNLYRSILLKPLL